MMKKVKKKKILQSSPECPKFFSRPHASQVNPAS
jgi:hypothetical protein